MNKLLRNIVFTDMAIRGMPERLINNTGLAQFRPPIALRTDLSHITTELWEIPVLRMAH